MLKTDPTVHNDLTSYMQAAAAAFFEQQVVAVDLKEGMTACADGRASCQTALR